MRPDELYHFGILGMKWGKRNGPPYPIADKDHSASEKKAGWRQSLRNKIRDRDDEYRYRQATKRRKQLDGSVPGGMQIRKLGRSQYYIEPVDPSQRRKIYKNGTIVPDYKSRGDIKREKLRNDALKFLDYSRKAYAESAKSHEKKVSSYQKDPNKVIKRETWKIGTGKNSQTRSYEVKAKDLISYHQEEALRDRTQEKYYSDLIKRYGNTPVSDMNKGDLAYLKKWGRQYTKFYASRGM